MTHWIDVYEKIQKKQVKEDSDSWKSNLIYVTPNRNHEIQTFLVFNILLLDKEKG